MELNLKEVLRKFKSPMQIGTHSLKEKYFLEGQIDGHDFELSVLPGLHVESFEQAKNQLESYLKSSKTNTNELYPSVRFAIESWQNLKSKRYLIPERVEQNALLLSPNLNELKDLRALGFTSFKLKIARLESANDIVKFLEALLPNEKVRLDGNQKMSPQSLNTILEALSAYWTKIDYIEEPFSDPNKTLNWQHPVPLAIDESLPFFLKDSLPKHIKNIVLKPALFGFDRSVNIIKLMNDGGVDVTLSSCFEGPIGLAAIFALAHHQNSFQPNPAGLDTLKYFKAI